MDANLMKQAAFGDLAYELDQTRVMLERIPEDRLDFKPHEKCMSLGELAGHLAEIPYWGQAVLDADSFDVGSVPMDQAPPPSKTEVLKRFDETAATLRKSLDSADAAGFGDAWTLRHGEQVLFTQPRGAVLRGMGINHLVHHRAQLGLYLRLLDVPLPAIYGPSADEGAMFEA